MLQKNIFKMFIITMVTFGYYFFYWLYDFYRLLQKEIKEGKSIIFTFIGYLVTQNPIIFTIFLYLISSKMKKLYESKNLNKKIHDENYYLVLIFSLISIFNKDFELNNIFLRSFAIFILIYFVQKDIDYFLRNTYSTYQFKNLFFLGKLDNQKVYYEEKKQKYLIEENDNKKGKNIKDIIIVIFPIIFFLYYMLNQKIEIFDVRVEESLMFYAVYLSFFLFIGLNYNEYKPYNNLKEINDEEIEKFKKENTYIDLFAKAKSNYIIFLALGIFMLFLIYDTIKFNPNMINSLKILIISIIFNGIISYFIYMKFILRINKAKTYFDQIN